MFRVVGLAVFIILWATGLPAAAAEPAEVDVASWVGNPGDHHFDVTTFTGQPVALSAGTTGPAGTPVVLVIDFSGLGDTAVSIEHSSGPCGRSGETYRCEWTSPGNAVILFASDTYGDKGTVRVRAEPREGTDPSPGNNSSTIGLEVINNKHTTFAVTATPAIIDTTIGSTATVTVSVVNQGTNTLGRIYLTPTNPGGGHYVGGSSDCVSTSCTVKNLPAGQTKTIQLRFAVDSCPPDSTAGALGVSWDSGAATYNRDASRVHYQLRIPGCTDYTGRPNGGSGGNSGGGLGSQTGGGQPVVVAGEALPSASPAETSAPATASPFEAAPGDTPRPLAVVPISRKGNAIAATAAAILVVFTAAAAGLLVYRRRRNASGLGDVQGERGPVGSTEVALPPGDTAKGHNAAAQ